MNERIRQLAIQTGAGEWGDSVVPAMMDIEKFAELIVQECIGYMNYRTEDWDAKLRWIFNDGSGYMEVNVDSLLKEHFGVEE